MRPRSIALALVVAGACAHAGSVASPATSGPATATPVVPTATSAPPTTSPPTSPTSAPSPSLPPGVPTSYAGDRAAGDVPPSKLVPPDAHVEGTWFAPMPDSTTTIVVAYGVGDDPFAAEHGLVVWSEFADAPRWRAVSGFRTTVRQGVLGISASTGDATGDGTPDVLSFASTGGSGGCGTYRLLSLANLADVYTRTVCDAVVEITPPGLRVTAAVFGPGDPHCCPTAQRVTTLRYVGGRWKTVSEDTIPLAP